MRVYLADRDIQHHAWAQGGAMRLYLADANTAGANFAPAHEAIMKLYLADANTTFDIKLAMQDDHMKIYLADGTTTMNKHGERHHAYQQSLAPRPLRILLSYHYFKHVDLDAAFAKAFVKPYPQVFLDSGGFSAFTQGETIDLQGYCEYIKQYKHLLTVYAVLDVIGSARDTVANQRRMEREGLHPLPVFHVGEDWQYLHDYIAQYPYVALGGMVPYMRRDKRAALMPWLLRCFQLARGKAVYHGFGCTTWEIIKALPWYSVDSSSWGQSFRFGQVPLFDARKGDFVSAHLGDHKGCFQYASLFRALGFDPADFAERSRNKREKNCAVSALSYMQAEQWLERRHGVITIPERVAL